MRNRIIAICFMAIIVVTAIGQKSYNLFAELVQGSLGSHFINIENTDNPGMKINENMSNVKQSVDNRVLDSIPYKTKMIKTNGRFLKAAGTRSYYNNMYGMNITDSGYNIGRYDETTTDFETEQLIRFKEYLDTKGIKFLYVSKPAKYIDDQYYSNQFGGNTYLNKNTDKLLSRIDEAGINYLDLRDCIIEDGLEPMSLFYKSDHHWTVPAAHWAALKIAEKLNEQYGYNINPVLYDLNYYNVEDYSKCWLGEQGRLVADTYIGLDDFTMIEPAFDTSFSIYEDDGTTSAEGNFGIFIDKSVYENTSDPYSSPSWHYSYNEYVGSTIHNNLINYGNVLIIGDSYERTLAPFLAMGIENVKVIIPREMEGSVRDVVEAGQYDTVIVAYVQSIIGGHDIENGANNRMFYFD